MSPLLFCSKKQHKEMISVKSMRKFSKALPVAHGIAEVLYALEINLTEVFPFREHCSHIAKGTPREREKSNPSGYEIIFLAKSEAITIRRITI